MNRGAGGALRARAGIAVLLLAVALSASGCSRGEDPTVAPTRNTEPAPEITVAGDVPYREVGGETLAVDLCLPAEPTGTDPVVMLLHGGGFTQGSRADEGIQNLCVWFAEQGYIGVPVSYRLGADEIFPAQLEDVQAAAAWLRDPAQVAAYGIDPARIGVLGSSAGAILAMSIGTFGEGPLTAGSRVGAVVSLSGVSAMSADAIDLGEPTPEGASLILAYLGCRSVTECPPAAEASPIAHVDASDSPALLFASDAEIVPFQQSEALADALTAAGVPAEAIIDPGTAHGLPLLTAENRTRILDFLTTHL